MNISKKIEILVENSKELAKILKSMDSKNFGKQQLEHYQQVISSLFSYISLITLKFETMKQRSTEESNFSKKLFETHIKDMKISEELNDYNDIVEDSQLELENQNFKNDLSDLLSDIENVEKSAYEITSLMNQIQNKISEGTEKIENIQKTSEVCEIKLKKGNGWTH
jgi:dephospho-CoA kinase